MIANDRKSYLDYLNKLVDQYNSTYHHFINKKPINADYFTLTKKLRRILKLLNLKFKFKIKVGRVRITKYKNGFSKAYNESWSRKIFIIDSLLKTNPRTYKI